MSWRARYGQRGAVGVIDLSTCTSLTAEFQAVAPRDVATVFSRLRLPGGEVTAQSLGVMIESARFEEAALELSDAGVNALVFACTSASLLMGPGSDAALAERLESVTGTASTTTATAVLDAFRALDVTRVSVGTPYDADITLRERDFFEASGLEVLAIEGLGLVQDRQIGALDFNEVRDLARRVHRVGAEAVFLSCTNLPSFAILAALERELGCPVFSSNAATIWKLYSMIDVTLARPDVCSLLGDRLL